ncbi:transcriptional regulator [Paenarthrobacter sp. NPDC090517]|uniref:transcriptional regulator n=1 Tax=Paenarthrobacter sp. NPDC090517 TaxID=3364381 RepID=UPI00382F3212
MPTLKPRNAGTHSNEPRVLIRDVIPYEVTESLDALQGPGEGILTLPQHVYWGPQAECDLGHPEDVYKAYQAILREGTRADQEQLLNADLLMKVWSELMLPVRVRDLWENKFPQLAQHS